jgi:hypothetical protein
MRVAWHVLVTGLLAGCASGIDERRSELAQWVGQPEVQLDAAMGAPHRTYDSGGMRFLTYEEVHVTQEPLGPYYLWPGPATMWGTSRSICDTTFTVAGGVVRAFSLQGNGCL